jgi:hypothetical protein
MAYVTITSDATHIEVDNGVYAGLDSPIGKIPKKSRFPKSSIIRVALEASEQWVTVAFAYDSAVFVLTYDLVSNARKVDTVDGIAPTSNADLYAKINALL